MASTSNNSAPVKPLKFILQDRLTVLKKYRGKFRNSMPSYWVRASNILQEVQVQNKSLDGFIAQKMSLYQKKAIDAVLLTLAHGREIDYLMKKTRIFANHTGANIWKLKILIAELLWGGQILQSHAKEVEIVDYYAETLREAFTEVTSIINNPLYENRLKLPVYVRINTLSISIEDSLTAFSKEGWNLLPAFDSYQYYLKILSILDGNNFMRDYHVSELLVFPPDTLFYDHPGYLRGKFLIQDKGSCLSSFLLNPKQNSVVLDMCAAPGIKTNHLANIMGNTGLIYAIDYHSARFDDLSKLLELTGVTCAKPIKDNYATANIDHESIKYILVDQTSSYSGIFYEVLRTGKAISKTNVGLKSDIALRCALQKYPNVKRVVFTTCSLYPEEGEIIVENVLREVGDSYTLLDVKEMLWNEWESVGLSQYECGNKCLRSVPEYDRCQGYFIAVFERNVDVPVPNYVHKVLQKGKLYNPEDMKEVEKVTGKGNVLIKLVPKHKEVKSIEEQIAFKQNRALKKQQLKRENKLTRRQIQRAQSKANLKKFKNPNWNNQNKVIQNFYHKNPTVTSNQQIYETTHSQLYP